MSFLQDMVVYSPSLSSRVRVRVLITLDTSFVFQWYFVNLLGGHCYLGTLLAARTKSDFNVSFETC